ncbi:response regulator transcription factor [Paludicola sp. MB14-C6]|uniref:response regulator transcription factor n=1 Tax=Paludihabitans sp. MB14-C6 TaxID=3070656 RepID=UPI0027DE7ADB|nr:response regulator transcription factor [Paludicola sp. MB14-C6]WMJ24418.1 response regulator transcription factor [Paludicola sp. MB14-C6]
MSKIYLVEDDESIRELVLYALQNSGHEAIGFEDAEPFFKVIKQNLPDLILLDIMLPTKDGIHILKELKNSCYCDIPVIMLTAKGSEFDKVKALDLGADDYMVKPFGVMEMLSRVNAVLRRMGVKKEIQEVIKTRDITIYPKKRVVFSNNQECNLTYKEYELLIYLIKNSNIVMTREKIMDAVWGFDYEGESRTVDMHIKTLRQKLGTEGSLIKTVRNVGYTIMTGE